MQAKILRTELREEQQNRRELKYPEDQEMLVAIRRLIRTMEKTNGEAVTVGKENNKSSEAKSISKDYLAHKTEMDDIVRLRKVGSSINAARMLHRAIGIAGCNTTVVWLLLKIGGDVNQQDENGCTSLHVAAASSNRQHCSPIWCSVVQT